MTRSDIVKLIFDELSINNNFYAYQEQDNELLIFIDESINNNLYEKFKNLFEDKYKFYNYTCTKFEASSYELSTTSGNVLGKKLQKYIPFVKIK